MSKVVLPEALCQKLAQEAALLARSLAPKRTGAGAKSVVGIWGPGKIGLRAGKTYMYFQNFGIKPFFMRSLEGKTIPLRINGKTVFRVARNVGAHQISSRDPKTGRIVQGNRPYRWRHPGLPARHFMEAALDITLLKYNPLIVSALQSLIVKEMHQLAVKGK